MAANQVGESDLVFGVTDETYGFFETLEYEVQSEKKEAMDGDGDVVGVAWHSKKTRVTGSYVYLNSGNTSEPSQQVGTGTPITITNTDGLPSADGPGDIYIDRAKETFAKADYKKVDFEGTFYPDLAS